MSDVIIIAIAVTGTVVGVIVGAFVWLVVSVAIDWWREPDDEPPTTDLEHQTIGGDHD